MGTNKYSDAKSFEEMAEKVELVEKTEDSKIEVEEAGSKNPPVETDETTE